MQLLYDNFYTIEMAGEVDGEQDMFSYTYSFIEESTLERFVGQVWESFTGGEFDARHARR